jgi:hypothetical protein
MMREAAAGTVGWWKDEGGARPSTKYVWNQRAPIL